MVEEGGVGGGSGGGDGGGGELVGYSPLQPGTVEVQTLPCGRPFWWWGGGGMKKQVRDGRSWKDS